MRVVDLTRECQYVWSDPVQGYVRCGRLAYWAGMVAINDITQVYFRCNEHSQKPVNVGIARGAMKRDIGNRLIDFFKVYGLGYHP